MRRPIYNMSIYVFPSKSIYVSDRQTDRQTDKPYSINIYRLGPTARRPRGMSVTPYLGAPPTPTPPRRPLAPSHRTPSP